MRFYDTHAHLFMLEHTTAAEAIKRAHEAGVTHMVTVSTEITNWEENKKLAETFPNMLFSLGVHPHSADDWAATKEKAEKEFKPLFEKCVAIGEIGLDYYYDNSPKEKQIVCLEDQLQWAKDLNLPCLFHCREAYPDMYKSVKKIGIRSKNPGLLHCFTGTEAEAFQGLDFGFKISFSGILTFKTADALRATAKKLPKNSVVLETDCPYLTPMPFRGKPNEPFYLPQTAKVLADVWGMSLEEVAEITFRNSQEVFSKT